MSFVVLHAVLYLLPAALLVIVLLARRYPGERVLIGLRGVKRVRWPRPRSSRPALRRVVLMTARGGRLIGCSLAVRPPPALYSAS
jgi:hypothetical protein